MSHGCGCGSAGLGERLADLEGTVDGTARVVADATEAVPARRAMAAKYRGWREGQPLDDWAANARLIAIDRDA